MLGYSLIISGEIVARELGGGDSPEDIGYLVTCVDAGLGKLLQHAGSHIT